jgi:hypothetical protein
MGSIIKPVVEEYLIIAEFPNIRESDKETQPHSLNFIVVKI